MLIHRNAVLFFLRDGKMAQLALPADVMQNLEVIDEAKATTLFTEFLHTSAIKNKNMLILLSDEVIFEKDIPLQPHSDIKAVSDDFINKVPLNPQFRSIVITEQQKQRVIYVTNGQLYHLLVAACKNLKNKIIAVSPAALFGVGAQKKYSKEELDHIIKQSSQVKNGNFLLKE